MQQKNKNTTILEESKEEDVSFNKSFTGHSPIHERQALFYNKSSVDDGTRSFLNNMRIGDYNEQSKDSTLGGIINNIKPNFSI